MSDLTLPGDIEGLLRRGSPGVDTASGQRGVIWDASDSSASMLTVDFHGDSHLLHYPSCAGGMEMLALDLTDATGRAHAAWWLGSNAMGGGGTWFMWHAALFWELRCSDGRSRSWTGRTGWKSCYIPALAPLDPEDPRLLKDGSRWVDAEALRLVCLHVAGRETNPMGYRQLDVLDTAANGGQGLGEDQ